MNGNGNGHYTNVSCRYHFLAARTRTLKALTTGNGHHCFNFLTKIRDLSERYTYIQLLGDKTKLHDLHIHKIESDYHNSLTWSSSLNTSFPQLFYQMLPSLHIFQQKRAKGTEYKSDLKQKQAERIPFQRPKRQQPWKKKTYP